MTRSQAAREAELSIDQGIVEHLDRWLMREFPADRYNEAIRQEMLILTAADEPYWINQGWWRVYDQSR